MINTSSPYQLNNSVRLKKEEPKVVQSVKSTTQTPQTTQTLPQNVDNSVVAMMRALAQHESGNRAVLPQEQGIGGASIYQYTTDTWKGVAQKYLGDANAPLTRANENKATYYRIKEWKDAGYKPAQIASMWNAGEGEPDAYTGKFSSGKPSIGTNDYGVNYNVPAHAQSVISKFQNELTKIKSESPTAPETTEPLGSPELKTEQTYFDKMKASSPLFRGGELALKGITKGIELADKAFRPTIGRATGYAVEQLGTGIGGAVGLVAGTGKEIYDFAKGGKFSVSDIGKAIEQTATETGKFGREIGTEGGVAAPFAGLGKIPSALVAAPSLYEGTKKMIQTKGQEGKTELAIGAAGLLGAKLSTGAWIDDPLKAMVKSGVNSPISKTAKVTDDIRNGYRSVLRPGKGEIMNIEVRQGKSIDNIIDFIAEEGVVIKSTPDGKMDTLEAIDFLKQKQQEPNRVLNEILSTDKTKKFDLMESAEKAFKELEATVKNADELNARKKEVLEFIQAEIERNGRYVDATTLNNIKSGMWSVGYNMGKPTSQSTARKLGHIMKESIEQNFKDQNIRNLNNLTGQYADALYMLKQAEGRVVPKGAIGQYVAQAIGAMAGSSVPLVGPLAGGWIGGKVGKYLASPERVTSKLMQKAQKAGIPKRSETIMKESIDAATKAKLQPKLPPLLEAGKSQSGAMQLPPISDTGKTLQSAKSYVTAVPAEVTTGRNVGTGQFKEVYKSTPKRPPTPQWSLNNETIENLDKIVIKKTATNNFAERQKDILSRLTDKQKQDFIDFKKRASFDFKPFEQRFRTVKEKFGLDALDPQFKSDGRAIEKAYDDYNLNFNSISDMSRGAFLVDSLDNTDAIIKDISNQFVVKNIKNRFNNSSLGYRDVLIKVELPNGTIGEIQIIPKAMSQAKDVNHILYEEWRQIAGEAKLGKLTSAQKDKMKILELKQSQSYNKAWGEIAGDYEKNKAKFLAIEKTKNLPVANTFGEISGKELQSVVDFIKKNNGITYDMIGKVPRSNEPLFAVSIYPEKTLTLEPKDLTSKTVFEYIRKNRKFLDKPNHFLGGWYDTDSQKIYLDIAVSTKDKAKAVDLGKKFNQKAIYDLMTFEEVPTGGTGEALLGSDILPRLFESKKL